MWGLPAGCLHKPDMLSAYFSTSSLSIKQRDAFIDSPSLVRGLQCLHGDCGAQKLTISTPLKLRTRTHDKHCHTLDVDYHRTLGASNIISHQSHKYEGLTRLYHQV